MLPGHSVLCVFYVRGIYVCVCTHPHTDVYEHTNAILFEWNRSPFTRIYMMSAQNTSKSGSIQLMVWSTEQWLQLGLKHRANPAGQTAAPLAVCTLTRAPGCNSCVRRVALWFHSVLCSGGGEVCRAGCELWKIQDENANQFKSRNTLLSFLAAWNSPLLLQCFSLIFSYSSDSRA